MSIPAPNYTQIPNLILDEWLPLLSGVQLKVLLAICRKTLGWHRTHDRISLSQLMKLTGCCRDKISDAIHWLLDNKMITKSVSGCNGQQETIYSLNMHNSNNCDQEQKDTPPSSQKLPTKETTQNKEALSGSKNKSYKRENRHIPEFLRIKGMQEEDWQKLANQFSEAHLIEAMQEAKSYHKNIAKILNIPAYITAACKRYMEKGNEQKRS